MTEYECVSCEALRPLVAAFLLRGHTYNELEKLTHISHRVIQRKMKEEDFMTVEMADALCIAIGLVFPIVYDSDDVFRLQLRKGTK